MTAFFDRLESEARESVSLAARIEQAILPLIHISTGDREFPEKWRERIQTLIVRDSIYRPINGSDRDFSINSEAFDGYGFDNSSALLASLHEAFHGVAKEKHQTRFGILSNDPWLNLLKRDEHDGTDIRSEIVSMSNISSFSCFANSWLEELFNE